MQQTSCNYELIIVDGGSTDGTLDVIRSYGGRIRYVSEPDDGIYDAMNKGVRMAKGEWVYFIGADDSLYSADVVKRLEAYMDESADEMKNDLPEAAYEIKNDIKESPDLLLCDIMSTTKGRCSSRFSWHIYWHNTIHHQGCIYRRKVLLEHPYDITLKIVADYDLNLYMWHNGYRIITTNILFANHSFEGISGNPRLINYKEEIEVRNRYVNNPLLRCLLAALSYTKMLLKCLSHSL